MLILHADKRKWNLQGVSQVRMCKKGKARRLGKRCQVRPPMSLKQPSVLTKALFSHLGRQNEPKIALEFEPRIETGAFSNETRHHRLLCDPRRIYLQVQRHVLFSFKIHTGRTRRWYQGNVGRRSLHAEIEKSSLSRDYQAKSPGEESRKNSPSEVSTGNE